MRKCFSIFHNVIDLQIQMKRLTIYWQIYKAIQIDCSLFAPCVNVGLPAAGRKTIDLMEMLKHIDFQKQVHTTQNTIAFLRMKDLINI